jgi:hypothetical protein
VREEIWRWESDHLRGDRIRSSPADRKGRQDGQRSREAVKPGRISCLRVRRRAYLHLSRAGVGQRQSRSRPMWKCSSPRGPEAWGRSRKGARGGRAWEKLNVRD